MKQTRNSLGLAFVIFAGSGVAASADTAVVEHAELNRTGNTWTVTVTLRHDDTGWDHYADGWGVYLPDGTELGYRVLTHPHVEEQPFTRSLSGIEIPEGTETIVIVPKDSVHGTGGEYAIKLK
ncbi:hypothetical protein [Neptunicoccus cionae]|uniref:hypothetical protein n=1 Tax=Neptunicoccus cionae TaxID=2035344 RepID=UPI000C775112|nr:hypothetical protein [Amylibacter cionae]PLS22704.1 hypothetical protein C0U40_00695 [Amylibacter cionae]